MSVAECVAVAEDVVVAESVALAGSGPLMSLRRRLVPVTVRAHGHWFVPGSGSWSVQLPVTMHVPGAGYADCHDAD